MTLLGITLSTETKLKISKALKNKPKPIGFGLKISKALTGRKLSEYHKQRISQTHKGMLGKHHTKSAKIKIGLAVSKANKGRSVWNKGIPWSLEVRKKLSESHKGQVPSKKHIQIARNRWKINNPLFNAEIRKRTSQRMKTNNPMFCKATVNKMINSNIKHYANGKMKCLGDRGAFLSKKNNCEIYYQSSYELLAYKILEQLNKVKSYNRCKFSIDYKVDNRVCKYIPDILVTYDDNSQEIIEVKADWLLNEASNLLKFAAARKYCETNNLKFLIWSKKDLGLL